MFEMEQRAIGSISEFQHRYLHYIHLTQQYVDKE